jgi:predicted  nucleic acid-binding Zn-ribbon protein
MEAHQGSMNSNGPEEPRTLEIAYSVTKGEVSKEIIFEDPTEIDKRPRLLVSLQSVLALKALCEREFDRVEVITDLLKHCREAYFKELTYLREQLKRATNPNYIGDGLSNYEVYWYDPPQYIDADLKAFLEDCIRLTNKKLIEENFELIEKLKAMGGNAAGGDDQDIIRMIRTLGPGGLARRLYAILQTPEHGSPQKIKDFEMAVRDLLKKDEGSDDDEDKSKDAKIRKLQNQIEKLLKQLADAEKNAKNAEQLDELRKALMEAQAKLAQEKARADQAEARAEAYEAELGTLRKQVDDLGKSNSGLAGSVSALANRIDKMVAKIDPSGALLPKLPTSGGTLSPIEASVSALEGCAAGKGGRGGGDADLEAKLKAKEDAERRLREEMAKLQEECRRLKKDLDRANAEAAKANAMLGKESGLASLQDELRRLREMNDKLIKEVEDLKEDSQNLRKQLKQAEEENAKLKEGGGGSAELQKELVETRNKLEKALQKITQLKEEIKRLKRMHGMDDDSDSDNSNYDGDLPLFLMSYVKRTRATTAKSRWQHLSEDARFARQKREFIYAHAHSNSVPNRSQFEQDLGPKQASEALNFLRKSSRRNSSLSPPPGPGGQRRTARHRSHSFIMREVEQEPVNTALQAINDIDMHMASHETIRGAANRALGLSNVNPHMVLDRNHVRDVATRTGHPLHRFEALAAGQGNPTLEAALAFRGAREAEDGPVIQKKRKDTSPSNPKPATPQMASRDLGAFGGVGGVGYSTRTLPPMMIAAGESDKPLSPLRGMEYASATLQIYDRARQHDVNKSRPSSPDSPTEHVVRGGRPPSQESRPGSLEGRRPKSREAISSLLSGQVVSDPAMNGGESAGIIMTGQAEAGKQATAASSTASGVAAVGKAPGGQAPGAFPQLVPHVADQSAGVQPISSLQIRSAAAVDPFAQLPAGGAPTAADAATFAALMGGRAGPGIDIASLERGVEGKAVLPPASSMPLGALEAVAASGGPYGQMSAYDGKVWTQADASLLARSPMEASQADVNRRELEVSPSDPGVHRIRTGGLIKMETPTEWSVVSRHKSPSPVRVDETRRPLPQGRPPSQGAPQTPGAPPSPGARTTSPCHSPSRSLVSKDGGPRSPSRDAINPREQIKPMPKDFDGPIAGLVAHHPRDGRPAGSEPMPAAAKASFVSSAGTAPGARRNFDPLPAEFSTSSADSGTLPPQDSITSTVGSIGSYGRGAAKVGQQGYTSALSKTPASRGRPGPRPGGAGFGSPSGTAPSPTRGVSTEFSPSLGSNAMSQSDGFAALRSSAAASMDGGKVSSPQRRTMTAGGQRDVTWGSRSTGSLPLTNTSGRNPNAGSISPTKQRRRPAVNDDRTAKDELAAANSEGHLPELLPAFKPGRIQKGPKTPGSWLVPL